jgi:hypothetical protein
LYSLRASVEYSPNSARSNAEPVGVIPLNWSYTVVPGGPLLMPPCGSVHDARASAATQTVASADAFM